MSVTWAAARLGTSVRLNRIWAPPSLIYVKGTPMEKVATCARMRCRITFWDWPLCVQRWKPATNGLSGLGPPGVTGPSGPVRTSAGSPEKPNACVYRKPHPVGARQNIYHRTEMIAHMCFGKSPVRGCGAQNSGPRGLRFTIARSACPARNCEPSRMIEVFLHHPIASGRMITILSALVP